MIKKVEWNGIEALEMSAGGYEALLIPSMGANLVRLRHTATGVEILRTPRPEEMDDFRGRPQIYGLPILFPPNRISDGTYTHNGRTYRYPITIPQQNNHHHGFLKVQPFTVTRCEASRDEVFVEASFFSNVFNDAIYGHFPHNFECRMQFRLSAKGLEHTAVFVNLDDVEMPVGVGYHTPINVPFAAGGNPDDYRIRLSAGRQWLLSKDRTLPTGEIVDPQGDLAGLASDEGIKPVGKALEALFEDKAIEVDGRPFHGAVMTDTKNNLQVRYEVDGQMKFWVFWNNGGGVPWACPEPMSWTIDAPNVDLPAEKTGFQAIPPRGNWQTTSKLYVK